MTGLTAKEMQAVERQAIASGAVTGLDLMERAGRGVVDAILDTWPEMGAGPRHALVLCGPGNNGGDGFVIARLLAARGWTLDVLLMGRPEKLQGDARTNHDRWAATGRVAPLSDEAVAAALGADPAPALIIDALFGTGLARPFLSLPGTRRAINTRRGGGRTRVVAVDIPSGLSADTGEFLGVTEEEARDTCIRADLTVTFHAAKRGHHLGIGPEACGRLVVVDIGL